MKSVNKSFKYIKTNLIQKAYESEHHFIVYGVLATLGYVSFYFFNSNIVNPEAYENAYVRITASILSSLLIFKNYWPPVITRFLPLYWYAILIFNLPFFFTFMLLHNPSNSIWQLYCAFALMQLILLVDWVSFILITILGISAAYCICYITIGIKLPDNFSVIFIIYISSIAYSILFLRNNEIAKNEKLETMRLLSSAIAHEMRTPLASIKMIATSLTEILPILLNSYKVSKNKNLIKESIEDHIYNELQSLPADLENITQNAFLFIDMLLMKLKGTAQHYSISNYKILFAVQNALNNYPIDDEEKSLIKVSIKEDFVFLGNETLFNHIIFNLLKNSLYYIKSTRKGSITIWTDTNGSVNKLYFQDTGGGINKSILPFIFDKFYSKTKYGTGLGLSFCKSVIEELGGKISCDSVEGEYTKFTLLFPKIV